MPRRSRAPVRWDAGRTLAYADGDDLVIDTSDDAAAIPKSVVIDESFEWEGDRLLRRPWDETVIYELHVKGFTRLLPGVRRTCAARTPGWHPTRPSHTSSISG